MALWLWLVQTEIIFQLCVLPSDTKSAITFEWMENKLHSLDVLFNRLSYDI